MTTRPLSDQIAKAEKSLGEPIFIYFNEETYRSRRNLILITFISLAYKLSNAKISSFNPIGINFQDYNPDFIDTAFFIFLLYNFIHFSWLSLDALFEFRVRITGTRLLHVTVGTFANEYADYPDDPRQSSLLNWWKSEAHKIGNIRQVVNNIQNTNSNLETLAKAKDLGELPNVNNIIQVSGRLTTNINHLASQLQNTEKAIASARIPVSLSRFENWFKLFGYSQLFRWFVLEWGLPIVLSLWALYLVFPWGQKTLIIFSSVINAIASCLGI